MLVSHGDESDGCGCEGSNVVTLKKAAVYFWMFRGRELNSRNSAIVLRRSSFGMRHRSNIAVSAVVLRVSRSVIWS